MNLSELLALYERRACEAEPIGSLAPLAGVYRQFIREVEELDGIATRTDTPDQWLTVEQAVQRIAMSTSWLYANQDRLPFVHKNGGRAIRISERGLAKWQAQ